MVKSVGVHWLVLALPGFDPEHGFPALLALSLRRVLRHLVLELAVISLEAVCYWQIAAST